MMNFLQTILLRLQAEEQRIARPEEMRQTRRSKQNEPRPARTDRGGGGVRLSGESRDQVEDKRSNEGRHETVTDILTDR